MIQFDDEEHIKEQQSWHIYRSAVAGTILDRKNIKNFITYSIFYKKCLQCVQIRFPFLDKDYRNLFLTFFRTISSTFSTLDIMNYITDHMRDPYISYACQIQTLDEDKFQVFIFDDLE